MENQDEENKKENVSPNVDEVEKDFEKIGILIQIVKFIFTIIAIGIFVWFIGKDLLHAMGVVDLNTDDLEKNKYTDIIEEITGEEF